MKRGRTAAQTAASAAKYRRATTEGTERKRKREVRVRYVDWPRQRMATGEALARLMVVGRALLDRVTDGREWRDGSHEAKRPRRKEKKGDG